MATSIKASLNTLNLLIPEVSTLQTQVATLMSEMTTAQQNITTLMAQALGNNAYGFNTNPANNYSVTGGSSVMMGADCTLTPLVTGRILVMARGIYNAPSGQTEIQGYYGTGSPPNQGDSPIGTAFGVHNAVDGLSAYLQWTFHGIILNATLGTLYWIDTNINPSSTTTNYYYHAITAVEF